MFHRAECYNSTAEAANKHRPLAEVRAEYAQAYEQALASVARLADDDLGDDSRLSAFLQR